MIAKRRIRSLRVCIMWMNLDIGLLRGMYVHCGLGHCESVSYEWTKYGGVMTEENANTFPKEYASLYRLSFAEVSWDFFAIFCLFCNRKKQVIRINHVSDVRVPQPSSWRLCDADHVTSSSGWELSVGVEQPWIAYPNIAYLFWRSVVPWSNQNQIRFI